MSTRKSAAIEESRYSAPALEKGLDVIELLAAEPNGLNLQEIARRLERTPNELFRMLDVLVRRGYLARQPDSAYVLTLRLFELAHRHPGVDRLLDCAMPHVQALAGHTGQSNRGSRFRLQERDYAIRLGRFPRRWAGSAVQPADLVTAER